MENKQIENKLKSLRERKERLENILKAGENHLVIAELRASNKFPEINQTIISFRYLKIAFLSELEEINKNISDLEEFQN